jgi:hypothetical protein
VAENPSRIALGRGFICRLPLNLILKVGFERAIPSICRPGYRRSQTIAGERSRKTAKRLSVRFCTNRVVTPSSAAYLRISRRRFLISNSRGGRSGHYSPFKRQRGIRSTVLSSNDNGLLQDADRTAAASPRLRARGFAAQQTEAAIGVAVLNRMLVAGRPDPVRRQPVTA